MQRPGLASTAPSVDHPTQTNPKGDPTNPIDPTNPTNPTNRKPQTHHC